MSGDDVRAVLVIIEIAVGVFAFWRASITADRGNTAKTVFWMVIWLGALLS